MKLKTQTICLTVCACLCAALLSGCDKDKANKSAAEIANGILKSGIAFPEEMIEVNADNLSLRYGLASDTYTEYSVYWAGSAYYVDEICVIQAADGKVDTVKSAVESRLDAQKKSYESYIPAQYDRLCASNITVRDNYVFWCVSDDNSKALSLFNDAFS